MSLHYNSCRPVVPALDKIVSFFTENHSALDQRPDWVTGPETTGLNLEQMKQLPSLAQAEIRGADDAARERELSRDSEEPFLDEEAIVITCALRFDGWKYKERTGLNQEKAFGDFFATGEWSISPLEQLAAFFLLQRGLFKWDLVLPSIRRLQMHNTTTTVAP